MRYYIIAGERSGDMHGGNLATSLRKFDPDAVMRGFGGEYMQKAGVELAVHYDDMAFMGVTEMVLKLNKISKYIKFCKEDIDGFEPDVIILIDYGGFNRRMAKHGKKTGVKVFYYIPPKVWAWYQVRALELKANVDRLFVILPFEKEFYKKYDWDVDYVGNPVLDAVKAHDPDDNFLQFEGFDRRKPIIALLPGSRKQEVMKIMPVLAEVVRHNPGYQFGVAAIDNFDRKLYAPLQGFPNVIFIYNKTYDLLRNAHAAIVTSGTATLETSLFRVPQIVVYKTNLLNYWFGKIVIKVPYISLVNLIADQEVVKELIQHDADPVTISATLRELLKEENRKVMLMNYETMIDKLNTEKPASDNAASLMVNYLKETSDQLAGKE